MIRRHGAVTLADVVAQLGQDEAAARPILTALEEQGFIDAVEEHGEARYRTHLTFHPGRSPGHELLQALEDDAEAQAPK